MSEQKSDQNLEYMNDTLEATAFIEAFDKIRPLFKAGNYVDRGQVNDRELLRLRKALNEDRERKLLEKVYIHDTALGEQLQSTQSELQFYLEDEDLNSYLDQVEEDLSKMSLRNEAE